MITKKIVLVGDFSTGKTSLIKRYVDNEFSDNYLTTIGVNISKKIVLTNEEKENIEIQLIIWDIEGNTSAKPTNPEYIIGAHGLILVADLTRENSIDNISLHISECQKKVKNIPIFLALNKSDLIDNQDEIKEVISKLESLHEEINFIYATSAKSGQNVENIFIKLSGLII